MLEKTRSKNAIVAAGWVPTNAVKGFPDHRFFLAPLQDNNKN